MADRVRPQKRRASRALARRTSGQVPPILRNAPTGTDIAVETASGDWMMAGATGAPPMPRGVAEGTNARDGLPRLFERFLSGDLTLARGPVLVIMILGWGGFVSWLFAEDNKLGRLDGFNGVLWFGFKAMVYSAFFLGVAWLLDRTLRERATVGR
jgi:hypothetical protein